MLLFIFEMKTETKTDEKLSVASSQGSPKLLSCMYGVKVVRGWPPKLFLRLCGVYIIPSLQSVVNFGVTQFSVRVYLSRNATVHTTTATSSNNNDTTMTYRMVYRVHQCLLVSSTPATLLMLMCEILFSYLVILYVGKTKFC